MTLPVNRRELREFGIVTGGMVALVFGLVLPWLLELQFPLWPWVIFAAALLVAFLAPNWLEPVQRGWMRVALMISKVTTPIVLGVVFFLVIWPYGTVSRLFRKDPMRRRLDDSCSSYRVKSPQSDKHDLENPY